MIVTSIGHINISGDMADRTATGSELNPSSGLRPLECTLICIMTDGFRQIGAGRRHRERTRRLPAVRAGGGRGRHTILVQYRLTNNCTS
jgi:hypothetical protein